LHHTIIKDDLIISFDEKNLTIRIKKNNKKIKKNAITDISAMKPLISL